MDGNDGIWFGVYRYFFEYERDHPHATFEEWEEYRKHNWEEFHWTEWYDDFYDDLASDL